MRTLFLLLGLALGSGLEASEAAAKGELRRELGRAHRITTPDGRLGDAHALSLQLDLPPEEAARLLFELAADELFLGARPELRLIDRKESLSGTHLRFRQHVVDLDVIGGEVTVSFDPNGSITSIHNRTVATGPFETAAAMRRSHLLLPALHGMQILEDDLAGWNDGGTLRVVRRVVARSTPLEPLLFLIDASSGELLETIPLFFNAAARVFMTNPVERLNDPSLRDHNDSASAVPPEAYTDVVLPDLDGSGRLAGPHVEIVDVDSPSTTPVDTRESMLFDRSHKGFEEVMAYFHLDRSQRYLQSLGYTGVRRIIDRPIRVDAHAVNGADNSFFVPTGFGVGALYFGDGGVDDAEDPDIILHEYGHAILESIAPSTFGGSVSSESRALGEAFGDYWAFSASYAGNLVSGRDPFCIGDWDARCGEGPSTACGYPAGADCLRRVDSPKTMNDYIVSQQAGTEHKNGEIYSTALREIFVTLAGSHGVEEGRRRTDRLVLESAFGAPPSPRFVTIARRMIEADRLLHGGQNAATLCGAFSARAILPLSECSSRPAGDLTLFQSGDRDLAIPDANSSGITSHRVVTDPRRVERVLVRVDIEHPFRGDLRLILFAPDGRSVVLQQPNNGPGRDLRVTYGLDAVPAQPLTELEGTIAAGTWSLQVIDVNRNDVGRLVSWDLLLGLEGDEPFGKRAVSSSERIVIPVVARVAGAERTDFVSDVRLASIAGAPAAMTLFFTPSGSDGRDDFGALRIVIDPGQTIELDDVVGRHFRTGGAGTLQIEGEVGRLVATSRTYNRVAEGTYGQFIPAAEPTALIARGGDRLVIPQLRSDAGFRSNIGFAEVEGGGGTVRVEIFDGDGALVSTREVEVPPFGHLQFPLVTGGDLVAARAEVAVVSGEARIAAYGSVIDNRSGDPIYVGAVPRPATERVVRIPAVARGPGEHETQWRSELWLTNASDETVSCEIVLHSDGGEVVGSAAFDLQGGEIRVIGDVLRDLFGLETAAGSIEARVAAGILVTSRSWTPGASGTFGQFIAARDREESIGQGDAAAIATQVESSGEFRTNVGAAETAGNEAVVRVRLFAAGGALLLEKLFPLGPHGRFQTGLVHQGAPLFRGGRIEIDVVSGPGRILGYASVIDNRTGDPIYVPAK
ncbi:MAG TPA: proprotein convertase P-domain-containing protein [Thermoanaerobaculia bacterium]|nr:proprotein convertase P-domain-containing protein [Thermoanaerobaculia bacterium]